MLTEISRFPRKGTPRIFAKNNSWIALRNPWVMTVRPLLTRRSLPYKAYWGSKFTKECTPKATFRCRRASNHNPGHCVQAHSWNLHDVGSWEGGDLD